MLLRQLKKANIIELDTNKVRTLEKPVSSEVWEYLEEQIEQLVNSKVRTLKTSIITKKEPLLETQILNGAGGGIRTHLFSFRRYEKRTQ